MARAGMAGPRFLALDTETTGSNPRTDRIVELFLLEVDDFLRPLRCWQQRFNPGIPIPDSATRVHGIRTNDIRDAPPFRSLAHRIQTLLAGAVLIAYNGCRFDVPLLHHELVRAGQAGLPPNPPVIDPYRLFLAEKPRSLTGAVRHYLSREHLEAHTAEGDTRAMLDVLRVQWATRHKDAPNLVDLVHRDERSWLDADHCFYHIPPSQEVMFAFGKHKDEQAKLFPAYLEWILQADFAPDTKAVARRILADGQGLTRWTSSQEGQYAQPGSVG